MADKVPLGKPLNLTDEELDLLAEVTPEDVAAARKLWIEAVEPEIEDLLDVQEVVTG